MKQIEQSLAILFSTFLSLLGVFVIARLQTLHSTIQEHFGGLERIIDDTHRYRLSRRTNVEIIEAVFTWLGQKNAGGRIVLFQPAEKTLDSIFDAITERFRLFTTFRFLVAGLTFTIILLLLDYVGFGSVKAVLLSISSSLLIVTIAMFIWDTVLDSPRQYQWMERALRWKQLKAQLIAEFRPQDEKKSPNA